MRKVVKLGDGNIFAEKVVMAVSTLTSCFKHGQTLAELKGQLQLVLLNVIPPDVSA